MGEGSGNTATRCGRHKALHLNIADHPLRLGSTADDRASGDRMCLDTRSATEIFLEPRFVDDCTHDGFKRCWPPKEAFLPKAYTALDRTHTPGVPEPFRDSGIDT